ncbi:hypothetical protein ACSFA2_06030 [Variovorax sp. LT2P21]|uniref:hypothetical protein n=1 Tax=Variovorax sp. LT2P21 TaxID=3443731 RepID=UPI003F481AF3
MPEQRQRAAAFVEHARFEHHRGDAGRDGFQRLRASGRKPTAARFRGELGMSEDAALDQLNDQMNKI